MIDCTVSFLLCQALALFVLVVTRFALLLQILSQLAQLVRVVGEVVACLPTQRVDVRLQLVSCLLQLVIELVLESQ